MNFSFITDVAAYSSDEILVMCYNLALLYFLWDVAKYILGFIRQKLKVGGLEK